MCTCTRCTDPTELGTFGSTLICQKCKKKKKGNKSINEDQFGFMMATNNHLNDSNPNWNTNCEDNTWKCTTCGNTKSEKEVENICWIIHKEAEELINSIPDKTSVSKFEAFIKKYEGSILHSNHMLLTNLKYSLSGFYGRLPGYEMQEMNATTLSRKKQICEESLQVLNKIDPGISPRRGIFCLAFNYIFSLIVISYYFMSFRDARSP